MDENIKFLTCMFIIFIVALIWGVNFLPLNSEGFCDYECGVYEHIDELTLKQKITPFYWFFSWIEYGLPANRCYRVCDINIETICEMVCDEDNNCYDEDCIENKSVKWKSKEDYFKYKDYWRLG